MSRPLLGSSKSLGLIVALIALIGIAYALFPWRPRFLPKAEDSRATNIQVVALQERLAQAPELTGAAKEILPAGRGRFSWDQLQSLSNAPVDSLNRYLLSVTEAQDKSRIVHALGFHGNGDSVALIIDELTRPKLHGEITLSEENVAGSGLIALGLLSRTQPEAWKFLTNACFAKFWEPYANWIPTRGHHPPILLAEKAIAGVGWSGHSDARNWLLQLTKMPMEGLESALMDAAFWLEYKEKYGSEAGRRRWVEGHSSHDFVMWLESEAGGPWVRWFNERMRKKGLLGFPLHSPTSESTGNRE